VNAISDIKVEGIEKLRLPFASNHISKLPKPTKQQTDAVKADFKKGVRCKDCGAWHHPDVVHLDYVGHAAATDRLLDTDLAWTWEPLAVDQRGLPAFDENGGLWIKLTVCGVTRLGYGSADGKSGGDAKKEIIGDAIRNAGMRFGMALDLWHKGDLHADDPVADEPAKPSEKPVAKEAFITDAQRSELIALAEAKGIEVRTLCDIGGVAGLNKLPADRFSGAKAWIAKQPTKNAGQGNHASDVLEDEIPY
jgi:hypothetical protein